MADVLDQAAKAALEREKQGDNPYFISDGGYAYDVTRTTGRGDAKVEFTERVNLSNFTAKITQQVIRDNGYEKSIKFTVEGKDSRGNAYPKTDVAAEDFSSMAWTLPAFGATAVIAAGNGKHDHLRAAVQLHSTDIVRKTIYEHSGWLKLSDKWVFLHGGGAIGAEGVETDLGPILSKYRFPDEVTDRVGAFKAALRFLGVAPHRVTIPLFAMLHLAPWSSTLSPSFVFMNRGSTGVRKTTVQALGLCFFGDFEMASFPLGWNSTPASLERMAAMAKDLPLGIDDARPGTNQRDTDAMFSNIDKYIRAQSNRQGRGRLRSDASQRATYTPAGITITSGEQEPTGHSTSPRLFVSTIEPGDVDIARLTAAQAERGRYSEHMRGFIEWVQPQYDVLQGKVRESFQAYREVTQEGDNHGKIAESIACLMTSLDMVTRYGAEIGAMTERERERLTDEAETIFRETGKAQAEKTEEQRPGRAFVDLLRGLLTQGGVCLHSKVLQPVDEHGDNSGHFSPTSKMIGWKDGDYAYLLKNESYGAVSEAAKRGNIPFSWNRDAVFSDLRLLEWTECDTGRTDKKVRIGREVPRVVYLRLDVLRGENQDV